MNEPIDEQSLHEYLNRGSEFSARYRGVEADDVPPELDRAVLSQAASAAKAVKPKLQTWRRFSVPVTLAATVVIAVSVVINLSNKATAPSPVAVTTVESVPVAIMIEEALPERTPAIAQSAEPERDEFAAAKMEAPRPAEMQMEMKRQAAAPEAAPAAAPSAARADERANSSLESVVVTGSLIRRTPEDSALPVEVISSEDLADTRRRTQTAQRAGPRGTVPAAPAVRNEAQLAKAMREVDAGAWLEYIRELRINGRSRDADLEWERFVKAYPTYPVTETDGARPRAAQSK